RIQEGRLWLDRVLAVSSTLDPGLRTLVLVNAIKLALVQGDQDRMRDLSSLALETLEAQVGESGESLEGQTEIILSPAGLGILAVGLFARDDLERAIRIGEKSLAICRRLPFSRPAAIRAFLPHLIGLSHLFQQKDDCSHADVLLLEALDLAEEVKDTATIGHTLWRRGAVARQQGNDRRALSFYKQALPFRRQSVTAIGFAFDLSILANLLTCMGEHAEAAPLLNEAIGLGKELQDPWATATVSMALAEAASAQGEPHNAIAEYEVALEHFRQLDERGGQAEVLGGLADVYRGIGDHSRAMNLQLEQLAIWEEFGFEREAAATYCSMGLTHLAQGTLQEAEDLCEQALAISNEHGDTARCGQAICALADIARQRGDVDRALNLYRQSISMCLAVGEQRGVGGGAVCLASLELTSGDIGRAARVLGMLVGLRETTSLSLNVATVAEFYRLLDTVRSKFGQATCERILEEGRVLLNSERDDGDHKDKYEAILTALANSPKRSERQPPSGLTPRELEVFQLLYQGMNDREIADALFISLSTVSTHVSSIYRKLDVASRSKAIAFARDRSLF
ncbi:MAG: tetratricopeptide repeat protein, partial [Candidatus Binatia bacterium]